MLPIIFLVQFPFVHTIRIIDTTVCGCATKNRKLVLMEKKKRSKMDGTGFFTYPHEWWWLCTQSMFVLHIFVIKAYKKRRDKEKEEIVKWEHSATKHFENHFSLKWNSLKNNLLKEERKARSYSRMRCHVFSGWMLFYNQMLLFQFLFFSISIYMSEVFFFYVIFKFKSISWCEKMELFRYQVSHAVVREKNKYIERERGRKALYL